jgi:hypothetical protein
MERLDKSRWVANNTSNAHVPWAWTDRYLTSLPFGIGLFSLGLDRSLLSLSLIVGLYSSFGILVCGSSYCKDFRKSSLAPRGVILSC